MNGEPKVSKGLKTWTPDIDVPHCWRLEHLILMAHIVENVTLTATNGSHFLPEIAIIIYFVRFSMFNKVSINGWNGA